jgi:hypothetical protein
LAAEHGLTLSREPLGFGIVGDDFDFARGEIRHFAEASETLAFSQFALNPLAEKED